MEASDRITQSHRRMKLRETMGAQNVRFTYVEWWGEPSPIVVVRYEISGRVQPLGLRLDLDKAAMLDRTNFPSVDDYLETTGAATITAFVNAERGPWWEMSHDVGEPTVEKID